SYGYHTPLAIQITQILIASKHYDLVARIPIHNSYGSGYYWVWSKRAVFWHLRDLQVGNQVTVIDAYIWEVRDEVRSVIGCILAACVSAAA
ncbi:MAG TPA: hypothetical protein VEP90_10500, partial [Methylomirabilota bacterium]|nr:hypothetical protein [Methylomirabilota bacterium]